jgi:hypothetical protein
MHSQTIMFPRKRLEKNRGAVFSVGSCRGAISGTSVEFSSVQRVVGYSPDNNEVSAKAEESPLLEAIARERLVKTQRTGKT